MQIKAEGMTINSTFKAKWIGPQLHERQKGLIQAADMPC